MKLAELMGDSIKGLKIRFVGLPAPAGFETSDGEPYYVWRLKSPVTVKCSVDKDIEGQEVDELYIRMEALDKDVKGDETEGYYLVEEEDGKTKEWVADYSKGQNACLYQSETIAKWTKGNRKLKLNEGRESINEKIRARQAAKRNNP